MEIWLERVVKAEGGPRGSRKVIGIRDLSKPATMKKCSRLLLKGKNVKDDRQVGHLNTLVYMRANINCL